MNVRWARLALVAASIAALTGCAPGADATPSTTSAGTTASAMASPTTTPADDTPTKSPQVLDDPSTWIVSGAGIGPLQRGAAFDPADPGTGPYAVEATACPNPSVTYLKGEGLANLSVVTEEDGSAIAFVQVTSWGTSGGVVSPSTVAGVRLGATLSELEAAYPGIQQTGTSNNSRLFAVEDSGGWIVFWIDDESVVNISAVPTSNVSSELCG